MAVTGWLIHKSAYARMQAGKAAHIEDWNARIERGLVRLSTVTRLELGFSSRSGEGGRQAFGLPPLSLMPIEYLTPDNDADHWDLIEGQGSLFHISYSGVTLALIHGGQPDALILCHEPTRTHMRGLPGYSLPSLEQLRDTALPLARIANPACQVVGIAVNTQHMETGGARDYLAGVSQRMGLPATDPYRFGADMLVDALAAI